MATTIAPSAEVLDATLTEAASIFQTLNPETRQMLDMFYAMFTNTGFEALVDQARAEIPAMAAQDRVVMERKFTELKYALSLSKELDEINAELEALSAETTELRSQLMYCTDPVEKAALRKRFDAAVQRVVEMKPRIMDVNEKAAESMSKIATAFMGGAL